MSQTFFNDFWWYWLATIAGSFGVVEVASIVVRRILFGQKIYDWTLSDCIRRWAAAHHWLPGVVTASMAVLCVHWFLMSNQ